MQAPSNGTKDVRWPATRIKGKRLVLASSIWLAGLHSLSLAAQELETPRAVRDTFSISSGCRLTDVHSSPSTAFV